MKKIFSIHSILLRALFCYLFFYVNSSAGCFEDLVAMTTYQEGRLNLYIPLSPHMLDENSLGPHDKSFLYFKLPPEVEMDKEWHPFDKDDLHPEDFSPFRGLIFWSEKDRIGVVASNVGLGHESLSLSLPKNAQILGGTRYKLASKFNDEEGIFQSSDFPTPDGRITEEKYFNIIFQLKE